MENAVTLEEVSKMTILTRQIKAESQNVDQYLLDKHYFRKHGKNVYCGQN